MAIHSDLSNYTHEQLAGYTHALLMLALNPYITDRTAEDVERWRTLRNKGWAAMTEEERQEWVGNIVPTPAASKGMYSYTDLNRVEVAVEALTARLKDMGYKSSVSSVKTDWTYQNEFWWADMVRYFGNIAAIREAIVVFPDTPVAPAIGDKMDYIVANNIEKILKDVDTISTNIQESWLYAGDLFAGEV